VHTLCPRAVNDNLGRRFMSAIKIENLTFSYYGYVKPIFENVSFSFDTNWKIGLIGRNGIGKSTLFKLLLNQETYQGKRMEII